MAELVSALCNLAILIKPEVYNKSKKKIVKFDVKNKDLINFDKELRLLAKRSALMLGAMNKKS